VQRRLLFALSVLGCAAGMACVIGPKQDDPIAGAPSIDAGFELDTSIASDTGSSFDAGMVPFYEAGGTSDVAPPPTGDGGDASSDAAEDASSDGASSDASSDGASSDAAESG
jgi:hypothetical protein